MYVFMYVCICVLTDKVTYLSITNNSQVSKIVSAFYLGLARKRFERRSFISNISAGITNLRRDLRVEQAWSKTHALMVRAWACK